MLIWMSLYLVLLCLNIAVENQSGLGFSNGSDWVLYGPELDKSMGMRNYLTMQLYRLTGRYASNTQYVEVFVVDDARPLSSHHYNGVYILMEKVKRGDNRVPIQKLSAEEDISGLTSLNQKASILSSRWLHLQGKHVFYGLRNN